MNRYRLNCRMATSQGRRKLLGILIGAALNVPKVGTDDAIAASAADGPKARNAAADNATKANASGADPNAGPPPDTASLSIASSDPCSVLVYPSDRDAAGDGSAPLRRIYPIGQRVWVSASLRSGNSYFARWEKDGAPFDAASTITLTMDADHRLRAIYDKPASDGIPVPPGTDTLRAALRANPKGGTTFYLRAGVHRFTSNVVPASGDTIIGEPGTVLRGSKVLTSFQRQGGHWIAADQKQNEAPWQRVSVCNADSPMCIHPERVYRDGEELRPVATLDALATGTFFFDYAAAAIHLFDDPSGHLIEATVGSGGITGFGTSQVKVTVRNLVFEQFGGGYVTGQSHNCVKATVGWLVEACEFRHVHHAVVAGGGAVIRNCHVHDVPAYGITGDSMLVEGCVLERANTGGFNVWNDAGPSKLFHSLNATWRGNLLRNNQGNAIWFDTDSKGLLIENNRIEDNVGMGVDNEVNCSAIIRYNLLRNNNKAGYAQGLHGGGQIGSRSSCNVEIYGNEIVALPGENGLGVRAPDRYAGKIHCTSAPIFTHDVQVRENVFRLSAGSLVGTIGGPRGYTAANNVSFSANSYYLPDLAGSHWRIDGGPLLSKEQWQAAGHDRTGRFLKA